VSCGSGYPVSWSVVACASTVEAGLDSDPDRRPHGEHGGMGVCILVVALLLMTSLHVVVFRAP
jgi:hypothetical protein